MESWRGRPGDAGAGPPSLLLLLLLLLQVTSVTALPSRFYLEGSQLWKFYPEGSLLWRFSALKVIPWSFFTLKVLCFENSAFWGSPALKIPCVAVVTRQVLCHEVQVLEVLLFRSSYIRCCCKVHAINLLPMKMRLFFSTGVLSLWFSHDILVMEQ